MRRRHVLLLRYILIVTALIFGILYNVKFQLLAYHDARAQSASEFEEKASVPSFSQSFSGRAGVLHAQDGPQSLGNAHLASARLPTDAKFQRQCLGISGLALQSLAEQIHETPEVAHFHNGRILDDSMSPAFETPGEFCSIFIIPQVLRTDMSRFQNLPIEFWGPDSIHAEISSNDIRLILPHPTYFGSVTVLNETDANHYTVAIYMAAFSLIHPGTYWVYGEVEFQNYDWVMEDPIDLTNEALPYDMLNISLTSISPPLEITGRPLSRPIERCYHEKDTNVTDLHGRWYRAESFNADGNQTKLNEEAELEFTRHNLTIDEWGWTFAPDSCSLAYFSPLEHISCFQDRTLQILGDSNSRRLLKSLISGGLAWCQDPTERLCQCEDHFESSFQDALRNEIDTNKFRDVTQRDEPTRFGRNSSVYFDFIGGVLNSKLWNTWQFFYDFSPNSPSVIARREQGHGQIDLLHISTLGWDLAAVITPAEMIKKLPQFQETLDSGYKLNMANGVMETRARPRTIHRLANAPCCGNTNHKTRYSLPRFTIFNAMYRDFWQEEEEAGTIRVVDASVLQGRRDAETAFYCPTTHLRASHVRLEQQMWMNAVCERVEDGSVMMRNW